MARGALLAAAIDTYAIVVVAIAALGLPLYQLRRDGFLRLRKPR